MPKKNRDKKAEGADKAPVPDRKRITPVDIQQKEFRVVWRGYREPEVDQFLDEVTEELARLYAENKRLMEDVEVTRTRRLDVGAAGDAEGILRRAREEAERILARARAASSRSPSQQPSSPAPPSGAMLGPFISREREFLQSLADLIQSHAEGVKQELRRARQATAPAQGQDVSPAAHRPVEPGPATQQSTQAWTLEKEGETSGLGESGAPRVEAGPEASEGSFQDHAGEATVTLQEPAPSLAGSALADREAATHEVSSQTQPDDIVDLTDVSGSPDDRWVRGNGVEPVARGAAPTEDDDEDRSLRELFWGED
jgi:DivIVA domain-containing protein